MKNKILSILFVSFLTLVLVLNIFIKDESISKSERRNLKKFPNISVSNILNKKFMEDFDEYTTDQFIMRDEFRNIKANINYNLFQKLDNNKIYVIDDYIFKSEYPTNKKSINNFITKINSISNYLTPNNKVYFSIIPDKNYYINNKNYLNIDYNYLYERTKEINYQYIELRDILTLNDYYKTDTHWKQENLCKVVNRLGEYLIFNTNCDYEKIEYDKFYGVYLGQSALKLKPEKLTYLVNDNILNSEVYYLENNKNNQVYILNNLSNLDSYDIFLDGASSYIEIVNKNGNKTKELILFRDSFGSSLAPLLIEFYSKITLIDIRYINEEEYLKKIDFTNQDVLFVYSTLIVNNSSALK